MGDGSNDLPMMEIAGLSIGYQPKPIVQEKADGTFNFVGLDGVLDVFQAP
jgi:phosphoserine phosphatase